MNCISRTWQEKKRMAHEGMIFFLIAYLLSLLWVPVVENERVYSLKDSVPMDGLSAWCIKYKPRELSGGIMFFQLTGRTD